MILTILTLMQVFVHMHICMDVCAHVYVYVHGCLYICILHITHFTSFTVLFTYIYVYLFVCVCVCIKLGHLSTVRTFIL